MKKLFVVDFDQTITMVHTHNQIIKSRVKQNDENACWEVVQNIPFIGGADAWKTFFKVAAQQGHHVYIASFNDFGFIIPKFLEKMGLTADEIAKIGIIAGFPAAEQDRKNKNAYIKGAIDYAKTKGFSGTASEVILIDDTRNNCTAAEEKGYQAILATPDASHIIELLKNILSNLYNSLDEFVDNIGSKGFNNGEYKKIRLHFNVIKSILNKKTEISEVLLTKLADRIKGFVDKANFLGPDLLSCDDKKIMSNLTLAMSILKGKITTQDKETLSKEDIHQTPPAVDRNNKPKSNYFNTSALPLFKVSSSPKSTENSAERIPVFNR